VSLRRELVNSAILKRFASESLVFAKDAPIALDLFGFGPSAAMARSQFAVEGEDISISVALGLLMLGSFRDYTATTKLNSSKFQNFLCAHTPGTGDNQRKHSLARD
jgi:hypothetical protein